MIKCAKCGTENGLGRVFCTACGAKLDLKDMTTEQIAESLKRSWIKRYWWIFPVVIGAWLLISVVFAFWAKSPKLGAEGTRIGGRRVESSLTAAANVAANKSANVQSLGIQQEYLEKDINGFFQFSKDGKMGKESIVRVKIEQGYFIVRYSRTLWTLSFGKFFTWKQRLTYSLECVPVGGLVRINSVSIGHLPVFGPLKSMVVKSIYKALSSQKEWESLRGITEIKAVPGKLIVKVNRK